MRSVAMATYQGMPYIREQMATILTQLAEDDEIIVSDNGSTDGTDLYVQSLSASDSRIRFFRYIEKKGVQANFQNTLAQCRGEIIFLCDQDDVWYEKRMDRMSELFAQNPALLAVQADAEIIDKDQHLISPSFFELRHSGSGVWKNFYKNTWQGCNMAIRRSLLDVAMPFPNSIPMHDMWIGILAELIGEVLFFPEILSGYRRHDDNKSGMKPSSGWQVFLWRIRLAGALLTRIPQIKKCKQTNK